jgi:hypothetical protein
LRQCAGLSGHSVFGALPDAQRLEAKRNIAFGCARLFQTFDYLQIDVVGLKPDFPIEDLQTDYRLVNAPRPVPTFPQNQVIIGLAIKNSLISQPWRRADCSLRLFYNSKTGRC